MNTHRPATRAASGAMCSTRARCEFQRAMRDQASLASFGTTKIRQYKSTSSRASKFAAFALAT
jgi:hypothetical protein